MLDKIIVKGARQNNLKNLDLELPRNKLIVITGMSGSGKSSLAFDTLYAEGQRRYVESLSAYARQFLDQLQKPDIDYIEGLSPAIAIEQRSSGSNPRSTVATMTEIYDYLRLLYANIGDAHCPECGKLLKAQSAQSIVQQILEYPENRKLILLSPVISRRKGEHKEIIDRLRSDGFVRCRVDNVIYDLENVPALTKTKQHQIEAVVDRLMTGQIDRSRLNDSVETALKYGQGNLIVMMENPNSSEQPWIEELISEHLACASCKKSFGKMEPRHFSFNSPDGACPHCNGIGSLLTMDEKLVIADPSLSIRQGAIPAWRKGHRRVIIYYNHLLKCLVEHLNFPKLLTTPWQNLPSHIQKVLLYGTEEEVVFDFWMRGKMHTMRRPFEGILANLEHRYKETEMDSVRDRLREFMIWTKCPKCHGKRLNPVSLAVTVAGISICEFNAMSIIDAIQFVSTLPSLFNAESAVIAKDIVKEINSRLCFLKNVGLGYLSLDRESGSLSGGEAQRIRLASQLGAGLVGILYILDEPSIGLHQRDNDRLINALMDLKKAGNTVLVVEHDLDTIRAADYVVDLGPAAGRHGGEIIAKGTPTEIIQNPNSVTGRFLSGVSKIEIPAERSQGNGHFLEIQGAQLNNLKNISVSIPLGTITCITGVSGSGKSTLVDETLRPILEAYLNKKTIPKEGCKSIDGLQFISRLISIDQSPIGRTPRSNPATYTDAYTPIRNLFAQLPEAKARGYTASRFSFNVKGGRCEECKGDGIKKIEMLFLPDVFVTCSMCGGKRFNEETLNIKYKKLSISDVLNLTVDEAVDVFEHYSPIFRKLKTLQSVGLGYIHLGQSATTLSGGEAQRVKLATELAKVPKGHTFYILDEPTTGLHLADIRFLMDVLIRLRNLGHTVLIIEHNLDVIKMADYIIDLGPEGGCEGGSVIVQGTPEKVAKCAKSYTGQYLKPLLKK